MPEAKPETKKQSKSEASVVEPAPKKANQASSVLKPPTKSEYVFLTRCIRDPETQGVYPLGKYLRKDLPAIAFEKGFAIAT